MRRTQVARGSAVVGLVLISLALVPGCRRAVEAPPPPTPVPDVPALAVKALDLPQHNAEIGITLGSLPDGLVTTYNGEYWIVITDEARPTFRYTFIADVADAPGISPTSARDFEAVIREYPDGEVVASGGLETAFGEASWTRGTYSEDGEILDDLRLFANHPSGSRTLILRSVCPAGLATAEERLAVMQELLAGIS